MNLASFEKILKNHYNRIVLIQFGDEVSEYQTQKLSVDVGKLKFKIKALKDRNQYADPDGEAAKVGICSASWSLFGQLWPASQVLASVVKKIDIRNRRFLELGCGLGLPSLVLQQRGADITASDYHPMSEVFLDKNATLNELEEVPFQQLDWQAPCRSMGEFDVIIGSDLLYEPHHAQLLAGLIDRIASPIAKIIITCPGRGYRNKLSRKLALLGFELTEHRVAFHEDEKPPFKGRVLVYRRGLEAGLLPA